MNFETSDTEGQSRMTPDFLRLGDWERMVLRYGVPYTVLSMLSVRCLREN